MIEQATSPTLIPVLVTRIRQRHVRAAQDFSRNSSNAVENKAKLLSGLQTQASWVPVTSTGMRMPSDMRVTECTSA